MEEFTVNEQGIHPTPRYVCAVDEPEKELKEERNG